MHPLILIPARLASTRLPNKPLAEIGGEPMIVQVWRRAVASGLGRVCVACDGEEIADAVRKAGGQAVLTDPDHPSGSDRIFEALQKLDPEAAHDVIVNLQGDLPTLDPGLIHAVLMPLENPEIDIATLAVEITRETEKTDPSVVKLVMAPLHTISRVSFLASPSSCGSTAGSRGEAGMDPAVEPQDDGEKAVIAEARGKSFRALYFTRATAPHGAGPLYHHIGIYAYRRAALERFVALPQGALELREKLEQLRALEHGMTIGVRLVETVPLGVDTSAQLEEARRVFAKERNM